MTIVFFWMASIYRFWPSVLALTGLPFAVMHRTSRPMVCTSASRPSRARPITYCTVCVPTASPRAAIPASAPIVRAAISTSASPPDIFSSVPRLTTETPSSRSSSLIFSSNAPNTAIRSSIRSIWIVFSMVCTLLSWCFIPARDAAAPRHPPPTPFPESCCHRPPPRRSARPRPPTAAKPPPPPARPSFPHGR